MSITPLSLNDILTFLTSYGFAKDKLPPYLFWVFFCIMQANFLEDCWGKFEVITKRPTML